MLRTGGRQLPLTAMELTGGLEEQVEKAGSKGEKKSLIGNAGMLLTDDELDMVSGGIVEPKPDCILPNSRLNES